MPWKRGERIPTNLIVGFLGSGKTTAITKLLDQRPTDEHWSVLVNEFGTVSIDHSLLASSEGVFVEKLGGGCACCTMAFAFKPLMAQFIRRTKPDRLILEPSGISHPAKVVDILRGKGFSGSIDLRNIICLVDPQDLDDPQRRDSEVFQDQIQLADIVVMNWTDLRDRKAIDRCREWIESFNPPKQLVTETCFGMIEPSLLDMRFETVRFPLFSEAHPSPSSDVEGDIPDSELTAVHIDQIEQPLDTVQLSSANQPSPGQPRRHENNGPGFEACGWVFHLDDVFDRDELFDFLGQVAPIARLKGVFRCEHDWWSINRAKEATRVSSSTYRRDSRLEVILTETSQDWNEFEACLLKCLFK